MKSENENTMNIVQIGACRGNDDLTPIINNSQIKQFVNVGSNGWMNLAVMNTNDTNLSL